tara:strand:- start:5302 stop:6366 length:1065 start_codon:yes stop_codon:yes gene_type:complete
MKSNSKYFKKLKFIPIDDFFEDVLYNKKYGYYIKNNPFEKSGDFITSPSISVLFSEIIAIWIILLWNNLNKPKKINIVELGPGNGKLSKVLIDTFEKFPEFYKTLSLFLYEKSKTLKKNQKKLINEKKVKWISDFKKIKNGPVIFFGNEFFDSIPIKQFKSKKNNLYEKFVFLDSKFNIKEVFKTADKNDKKILKKFKFFKNKKFIEFPKKGLFLLDKIIKKINLLNGGLLLIDYGFLKQSNTDTIQSLKNHRKNNIFKNLGKSDVTSLVNFKLLENYFKKNKLNVENIVSQGFFLKRMGILERAEILSKRMSFKEKSDIYFRIKRLVDPKFMGELFKVIFAHKIKKKKITGFF